MKISESPDPDLKLARSASEANRDLLSEEALSELERLKLNALAEFAAGAGHEINNPLTVISGHAQILLKTATDPDQRYHLSVILAQTRRAYEMIADIRLFARPPQPQIRPVDLRHFFEDFIRTTVSSAGSPNSEESNDEQNRNSLEVDLRFDGSPNIATDSAQLRTVLNALTKNSIEAFAGQSGRIWLEVSLVPIASKAKIKTTDSEESVELDGSDRQLLTIHIEDDGPGIPDEIREQVFSPYFSGRQAGRGLGFGLPKAWRLLEGLGGSIFGDRSKRFDSGCAWLLRIPVDSVGDFNEKE